ncbi:hypothetical protein [Paracoccus tibetensis]|uniref:Uncharacterized protein n=1 Tax=Paracoccus tibetensis TaxID=336292 RepID=A0A1G5HZ85_9RHOB|nr:hypothetical protein [Paracoccus tibetensis]SCY69113.1 hypothetical protein SAMN05660710_02403 [Paracoccus tibetensis]
MTQPNRSGLNVHLLILSPGAPAPAPEVEARRSLAAAAGLAGITELDGAAVAAHMPAAPASLRRDAEALFRAAAPAAMAEALARLSEDALLLVEIRQSADSLLEIPAAQQVAALAAAARGAPGGFIHGQALCWPQRHHVGSDCLILLEADDAEMVEAPFLWPSPSIYAATPGCLAFLHLWAEYARDPRLALARPDLLQPSSELLRGHQMAWAVGSVLAHRDGVAHLAPRIALTDLEAEDAAELPAPLREAWADGGLSLAEAGRWLQPGPDARPPLAAGRAAASPTPELLVRQLGQMLASGAGRICRDHLQALMRQDKAEDPLHAVLLEDRMRSTAPLWAGLVAQVNLIWTERQLDGMATTPEDMTPTIREALRRVLEDSDHLARQILSSLAWQLLGAHGRTRFRRVHGPIVSGSGRMAIRRFVDSLDPDFRAALTESPPPALRGELAPELRQRLDAWLLVAG